MTTGTVKVFNAQQGYGFIQPADGSADVFFHISAVAGAAVGALDEGQRVSFDVNTEDGNLAAVNLQLA
ncbi:cold-shock protein [Vineibacter terrae]|uniref:Cold-shock protein n=1 Tax=Vineibacter terrae TaxID=2586908 RepID=A0A5C8P9C6_9HYPH|nr:cold-shock protein [Vineibacter terrae]TXL70268.1 cold-shock protein [Vineibacter terrae]